MSNQDLGYMVMIFGGISMIAGFASLARRRQIQNVPTSRTRSMAAGPVELVGHSSLEPSLVSPLSGLPCAWWRYSIDEHRGGKHPWKQIASGDSNACPLRLVDASGEALVDLTDIDVTPPHVLVRRVRATDPRAATLIAAAAVRSSRRLRVVEHRIDPGDAILIHGVARVGTHVEPTRFRVLQLGVTRERSASWVVPDTSREASRKSVPMNPSGLRPALARRLRLLKREQLAGSGAKRLDPAELDTLRKRARAEVETERKQADMALARMAALGNPELALDKGQGGLGLLAALLLRMPQISDSEPVVGNDPLGQARCFLLPGDEERALRATRFGTAALIFGVLLIAGALLFR